MRRLHGPRSLRARLFIGIAATVAVSTIVMLAVGSALTRRSLDDDARRSLARQVDLIAAQHVATPLPRRNTDIGRFLATEDERLAILTPDQAGLLLPGSAAATLRTTGQADGTVDVRGESFLYAARLGGGDAIVLLRSARNQSADWNPFLVGLALAALLGAVLAVHRVAFHKDRGDNVVPGLCVSQEFLEEVVFVGRVPEMVVGIANRQRRFQHILDRQT